MSSPASALAIWAIGVYQRFVSPRKGFRCAHHACTGGMTCSKYGLHALREHGFLRALPRIRERLVQCSEYATDPFEGKISEDDPGPLRACTDDKGIGGCEGAACAGCVSFDVFGLFFS